MLAAKSGTDSLLLLADVIRTEILCIVPYVARASTHYLLTDIIIRCLGVPVYKKVKQRLIQVLLYHYEQKLVFYS